MYFPSVSSIQRMPLPLNTSPGNCALRKSRRFVDRERLVAHEGDRGESIARKMLMSGRIGSGVLVPNDIA
jgi:hypothetical protein